jgi:hypothetical protein
MGLTQRVAMEIAGAVEPPRGAMSPLGGKAYEAAAAIEGQAQMKYQIAERWPVGSRLIEADTVIDTTLAGWVSLSWVPPPMDAIALDQVTYDYMTSRLGYPVSKVRAGPGVVSKALPLAKDDWEER